MTEFHPAWPLTDLRGADYNPRSITPEAFEALQDSLRRFGIVKPVILNADGTLVAGHQRTKAMHALGITHTPAVMLGSVLSRPEEIQANLLHNSIETAHQTTDLTPPPPGTYEMVPWDRVRPGQAMTGHAWSQAAIGDLLRRYGPWGSVVCDSTGRVLLNSDYAAVCHLLRLPVLTYTVPDEHRDGLLTSLGLDYGRYDYTNLGVREYHQTYAQPARRAVKGADDPRGTVYERFVEKDLQPGDRVIDFGAGRMNDVARLRRKGVNIVGYEPYYRHPGRNEFDYRAILGHLRDVHGSLRQGLFDRVVCDSVLNSTTSLDYVDKVCRTLAALTAPTGTLYLTTRNLGHHLAAQARERSHDGSHLARVFLDPDGFTATYRAGAWTLQRYYDRDTLHAHLDPYFEQVEIHGGATRAQVYAVCKHPRPQDPALLREALETEFDLPYPDGFRLGKAGPIIERLITLQPPTPGGLE